MARGRRWFWLAGALVVALGALAWGIPLATLLTIAALLACPAAMFLGMGMMGRMQDGGMACRSEAPAGTREGTRQASLPGPSGSEASAAPPGRADSAASCLRAASERPCMPRPGGSPSCGVVRTMLPSR